MTETIQQLKEDIAILQEKLQKLEELQRTKSPVEEAYKDWWGEYPGTEIWTKDDEIRWVSFSAGYNASKVSETPQEPEDNEWTIEKLQEKNWYVDAKTLLKSKEPEENDWKTVALLFGKKLPVIPPYGYDELSPNAWYTWVVFNYDYYIKQRDIESGHYPTPPQTPEQIEKSLKEAFVKAQQTEEWKETQRKIDAPKESWMNKSDEELVAILEKNPPDCLKFVMGKTLEQIIERWWCDTFTGPHEKWTMEECIDDLIDQIELFLPRSQSSEGTQNIDTVVAVEAHNELLQKIKSKLRNKKDT
jgi:hypothetical protein